MKIFVLIAAFILSSFALENNIYDIRFNDIDGSDMTVNTFQGKKIMVIVLPVTQHSADSALLRSLDSLSNSYPGLAVMAVPPFEDGFDPSNSDALKSFYKGMLNSHITITKGMYTRKGAAYNQHALFSWLTHSDKNAHFNQDVEGPGQKFFINSTGELYAVVGPSMPLWNHRIQSLIQQ